MTNNPVRASIIINNYNYGRFLKDAIDSALNQTYPHTEVIVVDDGSTDESAEVIRSFGNAVDAIFKENEGQGSAFNVGYLRCRGDVVLFLDADDFLRPNAVERTAKLFADPGVSKVHWPLDRVNRDGTPTGTRVPETALIDGDLRSLVIEHGPGTYDEFPYSPPTSGNAWARWFLDQVLPMPEAPFRLGADAYLFTLGAVCGVTRAINEPLAYYRVHGSNDTLKPLERRLTESLERYEHRRIALVGHLAKAGLQMTSSGWARNTWFHRIEASLHDIDTLLPHDAAFILVDDNHWGAGNTLKGRRRLHFTEQDGTYWGPPSDDDAAILELERLRAHGTEYIVFAWTSFWWLEYYRGLHEYLRSRFSCLLQNDRLVVFHIAEGLPGQVGP